MARQERFRSGMTSPIIGFWNVQGRLIDHLRNSESVGLEDLQLLVLDEADRLLDLGFSQEVDTCSFNPKDMA